MDTVCRLRDLRQLSCGRPLRVALRIAIRPSSVRPSCLIRKILSTGQPPNYMRSLLNPYSPHRTLRSVNQHLPGNLGFTTEFGKRPFSYFVPKI